MNNIIRLWNGDAPYAEFSPGQKNPTLTEYACKNSKGAIVVIPGGGYAMKARHEGEPIAKMLNEAGISAYVLDYRVRPCHKNAPLSDANRAVRVVRSMGYQLVGVLGFSAGGNLCVNAAVHCDLGIADSSDPIERLSSRPDAFVPCYAVVSFVSSTHVGSALCLLGEKVFDQNELKYFSGELHVTPSTPPAFIWHTADDAVVPVKNSINLASALSANNVPFELHIFPHGNHGLGLANDSKSVSQWQNLLKTWLLEQGFAN